MAVDFNQYPNGLVYAYHTLGTSGSGSSLVAMGDDFSVFARVNLAGNPGPLGAFIGGCVNMPTGFGGYNSMGLRIATDRRVWARAGGNPGFEQAFSATAIPLNEWVAAGASISQGSIKAYLDGVAGTENTDAWSGGTLEETIIGAYPTVTVGTFVAPFSHCIEDLAFWNVSLSDEQQLELTTLFGDDIKNYDPAPVLYVPFVDATTAADATHNGSPITLSFKAYNADPSDEASTVDTCSTSPEAPVETGAEAADECGAEDEADAAGPCDVEWPACELVPGRISVDVFSPSVSPGRSFSGLEQLIQPDAGHWRITYNDIRISTKAHALRWRAIESALSGRNGTVCVPLYAAKLSGTPIAAIAAGDAGIGQTRLDIEQTAGADIRPGMHFSVGERAYCLATVTQQETGGPITATISPPLREAISAAAELNFNTPRLRCRLERDDSMVSNAIRNCPLCVMKNCPHPRVHDLG
jgi:hypothetical protein